METNEIKEKILALTALRYPKTICPSEVLPTEQKKDKTLMQIVRAVALELVIENKIVIMQKNKVIDPTNIKGPIRLRFK